MTDTELIKKYSYLIYRCIRGVKIPPYIEKSDLYQEGCIGLLKAKEKYDNKKNTKFITYAFYYVRGYILRHIHNNCYMEHVPVENHEITKKVFKYINSHPDEATNFSKIAKGANIPEKFVKFGIDLDNRSNNYRSLYQDGIDRILELSYEEKNDEYIDNEYYKKLYKRLSIGLTQRQKDVLEMRAGIRNGVPESFVSIGKKLNISQQCAHAYYEAAINKIAKRGKARHVHI